MGNRILETSVFRPLVGLVLAASVLFLNGCGGGSGAQSGGTSTNAVNVSLAATSVAPAAPAVSGATAAPSKPSPPQDIDHAWITVERIALLPADSSDGSPDPDGEAVAESDGPPVGGMIASDVTPTEVDLLNLPAGQAARFLNAIDNVPAGRYHKIRLYYRDPKVHFSGDADNTAMHATAHFHLDIHFVGGDLVIPVGTDPNGGVKVHNVGVVFVLGKDGLKINVNPSKILMRPQVFATVSEVEYVVSGVADNVDKLLGSFDIATAGGRSFHVEYDSATAWFFRDPDRWVGTEDANGISALRNGVTVDAIGLFDAGMILRASDALVTLPDVVTGKVFIGWNVVDNTFTLRFAGDNVVFPMPDRASAYYDDAATYGRLYDTAITDNAVVTARGFLNPGSKGIDAYWISVGP